MNNSVSWNYLEANAGYRYRQRVGAAASTLSLIIATIVFAVVVASFWYYDATREAALAESVRALERVYNEKTAERRTALRLANDVEARDAALVGKIEALRISGSDAMRLYEQVGSKAIRPQGTWLNKVDVAAGRMTIAGGAHSIPDALDYYGLLAERLSLVPAGLPTIDFHSAAHNYVTFEFVFASQ